MPELPSKRSAPPPSSPAATSMGKANRGRDTGPELRLRSTLHRRGLRFRVNRRPERGVRTTPDITFGPARVVVFLDGCFWHRCPIHGTEPKANGEWWSKKLDENVARDRRADEELARRDWRVIRVWAHEDVERVADMIEQAVRNRPRSATLLACEEGA